MITSPERLSPEHLTGLLRRSGCLDRGSVIKIETRLTKQLDDSAVSRLDISYSADAPVSAPRNLFLKISKPLNTHGEPGKEVEFYDLIAPRMDEAHLIRCYDAGFSAISGASHLLLEDLTDTHSQPTSPQPPSTLRSEAAVECLARLHAFWREHPDLGRGIGSLFDKDELDRFVDGVEKDVVAFMSFLGDRLPAEGRRMYEEMLASKHAIWGRLTDARGLTVTHGDAHWWNFLYPLEPATHHVRLFDWQLWHVDLGARDLAFLVALGGFSEPRPDMEQHLTRHYHDTLISCGVSNYSWDEFFRDYRLSAVRNLNIPAIQWSQGKSEQFWWSNLERAVAAYDRLGCCEVLGD